MHHADFRWLDGKQRNHLAFGEFGDGDDEIGARGRIASLRREAEAELGRGVLTGHHEQVVEGGHGAAHGEARQALVQTVEQAGRARAPRFREQAAPRVGGQFLRPGAEVAVRPVAEIEAHFRMRRGRPEQDLAGIQPDPGKRLVQAIRCVECDSQSNLYSFIFRYKVVRPMLSRRAALVRSPLVAASAREMAWRSDSGSEMRSELGASEICGSSAAYPDPSAAMAVESCRKLDAARWHCSAEGMSAVWMTPSDCRAAMRSRQCFSSRTLPGQS